MNVVADNNNNNRYRTQTASAGFAFVCTARTEITKHVKSSTFDKRRKTSYIIYMYNDRRHESTNA